MLYFFGCMPFYIVLFEKCIDVFIYFLFIVKSDVYFDRLKGNLLF